MKIFYAVQATGNGHISRAMELLPYLKEFGTVDIFLSGNNSQLDCNLPVTYKSKGVSLYTNKTGGLDYVKTMMKIHPLRIWREAKDLPLYKYDLILNDFECITSLACKIQNKPSIHFGHQASFQLKNVPRPEKKDRVSEFVLNNFARGSLNIGLHFKPYDARILSPIVRKTVLDCEPNDGGYIAVYLPQYGIKDLIHKFAQYTEFCFRIHTPDFGYMHNSKNITLYPLQLDLFTTNMSACSGLISGAGFETPAEALALGKKLMVIPIQNHYEQLCNAAALAEFNVYSLPALASLSRDILYQWLYNMSTLKLNLQYSTSEIAAIAINTSEHLKTINMQNELLYPLH